MIASMNLAYEKYGDLTLRALGRLDSSHIMRLFESLGNDGHKYAHASRWLPSFLKDLRHSLFYSPLRKEMQSSLEHILFEDMWNTEVRFHAALCLAQLKQHDGDGEVSAIKDIARWIAKGDLKDHDARLLGKVMLLHSSQWSLEEVMDLLQGASVKMVEQPVVAGDQIRPLQHFLHEVFPSHELKRKGVQGFGELLDSMSDILAQPVSSKEETGYCILRKVSSRVLLELFGSWWQVAFQGSSNSQQDSFFDAARINDYLCPPRFILHRQVLHCVAILSVSTYRSILNSLKIF